MAFYNYGINGVSVNKKNKKVFDISYGRNKSPLHICQKDILDFIKAIITYDERNKIGITDTMLSDELRKNGVRVIDYLLRGRAMILITEHKTYLEYDNITQNAIQLIAGMDINGNLDTENAFPYKELSVEELYSEFCSEH